MAANRVRAILRDPKRLAPWAIFVAWVVATFPFRFLRRGQPPLLDPVLVPVAAVAPGLVLAAVGLVARRSAHRAPAAFASPADARFLCASALPPRVVVLWLQVRRIVGWRLLPAIVVWIVAVPSTLRLSLSAASAGAASLLLLGGILLGLELPLFVARERSRRLPLQPIAYALMAAGLAAAAVGLAATWPGGPRNPIALELYPIATALPPGSWVVAGFWQQPAGLFLLAAAAACCTALTVVAGGDCYPELWESSTRMFQLRRVINQGGVMTMSERVRVLRKLRQAGQPPSERRVTSPRVRRVPPGAWTVLWKEWLSLRRSTNGSFWITISLAAALVIGAAIGQVAVRGPRGLAVVIALNVVYPLVMVTAVLPTRLASDLKIPIWWLSADPLSGRLGSWVLARCLRQFVPLAVGLVTAAVVSGQPSLLPAALALTLASACTLRAISLAVYTLLPSPTDMRGPGALLRMFGTLALALPPAAAATAAGIGTRSITVTLLAASLVAAAEAVLLVLVAARRLRGNGLAFARAERR